MIQSFRSRLCEVLFFSLVFAFQACKKEEASSPVTSNRNTISVTITDENGIAISGASLKLNNKHSGTSNDAGICTFKDVTASDSRFFVVSTAYGYFNASQSVELPSGKSGEIRLILTAKGVSHNIDGLTGGAVNLPSGAKVVFPANRFQTASGATYSGNVKVYLTHYDPTSANFSVRMPGGADMAGIRTDGSPSTLVSYGALSVELEDGTGEKIELKSGQKAQITVPVPASMGSSAPANIPLWHFDETKGKWVEEGSAIKVGNSYVGEVSHFSAWNCDDPRDRATVKGKVVDCNGNPFPGAPVYLGPVTVVSGVDGTFERFVPSGINFEVKAGWPGFMTNTTNISALASGEIAEGGILQMPGCMIPVTGTVVNCDNQSIPFIATYSFSTTGGNSQSLTNSQNGPVQFVAIPGSQMNITFFSLSNNTSKHISVSVPLSGSLDLGVVKLCGPVGTGTFFSCKIDNIPCSFNSLVEIQSFSLNLSDSTHIYAESQAISYQSDYTTGQSFIGIENPVTMPKTYILDAYSPSPYTIKIYFKSGTPGGPEQFLYAINGDLAITKYGSVGGRIEGTFKGTFKASNSLTNYTITDGKFSIRRQ